MRFKQLLMVSMVAAALSACGAEQNQQSSYAPAEPMGKAVEGANSATAPDTPAIAASSSATAPIDPNKINSAAPMQASAVITHETVNGHQIVVSADLNFETDNVRKTVADIEELAGKHSGFVSFSEIETYPNGTQSYPKADGNILHLTRYTYEGNMILRIPREKSSEFLRDLQQHIVFLDKQIFKAEDIGLSLRKQVLEAQRQQELATKLDELARSTQHRTRAEQTEAEIRAQFDAKGRENEAILQQDYWRDRMEMATITLRFRQPEAVIQQLLPNPDAVAKQHRPHFWTVLWNMIKQGWDGVLAVLLFFMGFWPITLGIPLVYFGLRYSRKLRSRRLTRKLAQAVQTSRRRNHNEEIDDFD